MKMSVQGGYISQLMRYFLATLLLLCTSLVYAQDNLSAPLLTPEQAFAFSVESTKTNQARLHWTIQPNYYLYQHKFEVQQGNQPVTLKLPKAIEQYDENYGHSQVYYQQAEFEISTQASVLHGRVVPKTVFAIHLKILNFKPMLMGWLVSKMSVLIHKNVF